MKRIIVVLLMLSLGACGGGKQQSSTSDSGATSAPSVSSASGTYRVLLSTTRGPVVIEVDPSLAPVGAKHFADLVNAKYFDGARFYRVVPNFVVQWGSAADPKVSKKWDVNIPDEPVKTSNVRGTVSFAATGQPNSRSTHLFINLADNPNLDGMGFAPIGKVVSGMDNVDKIYAGYGDRPDQGEMAERGNAYLIKEFPKLDYIKTARIQK